MAFAVPIFSEGFDETHVLKYVIAICSFQNISMVARTFKEAMSIDIKGIKVPADGVCSPNFSEGFDETHISMPLQSALTFFKISQ